MQHFSEGEADLSQCGVLFTAYPRETGEQSGDLQFVLSNSPAVSIHVSSGKLHSDCNCHKAIGYLIVSSKPSSNRQGVDQNFSFIREILLSRILTLQHIIYGKVHCGIKIAALVGSFYAHCYVVFYNLHVPEIFCTFFNFQATKCAEDEIHERLMQETRDILERQKFIFGNR